MAPMDAVEVADANRDIIVGIKVRVGARASGRSGTAPLDIALQVAEEVGLPLMAHIDEPPPSYEEVIARLRPGDVLTHAFRPYPNSPATAQGTVKPAVRDARRRGVLFDIGHGKGSFAFKTARAMLANGFFPDTISSDVHALSIKGPAFDQVTTMSKFLCLGMPIADVIAASTINAALALKRPELGTFAPAAPATQPFFRSKRGASTMWTWWASALPATARSPQRAWSSRAGGGILKVAKGERRLANRKRKSKAPRSFRLPLLGARKVAVSAGAVVDVPASIAASSS